MAVSANTRTLNILICDGDPTHDWSPFFLGKNLNDGSTFRVVQASWMEISVVSYSDGGVYSHLIVCYFEQIINIFSQTKVVAWLL